MQGSVVEQILCARTDSGQAFQVELKKDTIAEITIAISQIAAHHGTYGPTTAFILNAGLELEQVVVRE
jgi:hypothetical protein